MTQTYIFSTCGTSIFTNNCDEETRKIINLNSNKLENEIEQKDKAIINARIKEVEKLLNEADVEEAKKMSAELNGLLTFIYKNNLYQKKSDLILYFITTHTYIGEKAGELCMKWAEKAGFNKVQSKKIQDLKTSDINSFNLGLSEMIKFFNEGFFQNKKSDKTMKLVFNLSGGFKSVNACVQTIVNGYADEIFFIFETSDDIMYIPSFPVKWDDNGEIEKNLFQFRKLKLGLMKEKPTISPIYWFESDGEYSLAGWGDYVFESYIKDELYEKKVFPSFDESLVKFGDKFLTSIEKEKLEKDKIRGINLRIDDLVNFLKTGQNPNRLDFKPLRDVHKNGISTHECDAWAHGSAKRIYCHYSDKNGKLPLILDELGEHL